MLKLLFNSAIVSYIFTMIIMFIFVLLSFMSNNVNAKTDFDIYINKVCKTNCIKGDTLTNIALDAVKGTSLNFKLVIAIIKTESRFNIKARNGSSEGLTQVHRKIHKDKLKGKSLFNPTVAVNIGVSILNSCYKRNSKYGISKVLKCYNGGGDPLYASKVLSTYKRLLKIKDFKTPTIFVTLERKLYEVGKDIRSWWGWDQHHQQIQGNSGVLRIARDRNRIYRYKLFQYRPGFY